MRTVARFLDSQLILLFMGYLQSLVSKGCWSNLDLSFEYLVRAVFLCSHMFLALELLCPPLQSFQRRYFLSARERYIPGGILLRAALTRFSAAMLWVGIAPSLLADNLLGGRAANSLWVRVLTEPADLEIETDRDGWFITNNKDPKRRGLQTPAV